MREDINYFPNLTDENFFAAEICGISYCDGTYYQKRVCSEVCVTEYILSGTGTVNVNGESFAPEAGDVYILPPGSDHEYFSDKINPWIKIFINARGSLIPALLSAYKLEGRVLFRETGAERLFRELYELSGSRLDVSRKNEQCALKFHEIIIALAANEKRETAVSDDAARIKGMIDSRIDYTYSIGELAAAVYHSEDYVIKLFRRSFGQTPYAYALQLKMRTAARLLSETCLPVSEIALMTGYDDPRYFCNVFKRYYKCAPTVFRKRG